MSIELFNGGCKKFVMNKVYISILFFLIACSFAFSQENTFKNPILTGGYPDPSICRVGDDYYIVNSSFEYFPGLPIHHSKDLVNWDLVGYGLHRKEQCTGAVNLVDVQSMGGIHAPTIRYRNGKFYIITTNVYSPLDRTKPTEMVNFIITADHVEGPWSEPHVLEGAPGIDPDIFFDADGRVWYTGTHVPDKPNFQGEGEIWLQEIDLTNWKLKGDRTYLWRGACAGIWSEGPHLYKRDGRYYLQIAEGGTHFNHAVMIAVSDSIKGPYISNDRNPILTSRNLSYNNWVNSTGHADLVELPDGRWYMVSLGIRGDVTTKSNMGRETHMVPVQWEREPFEWKKIKYDWPVAAPLTGKIEKENPLPFSDAPQFRNDFFSDNFDGNAIGLEWNFRRVPLDGIYSLNDRIGYLRLHAKEEVIKERGRTSLMGFRQRESDFEYSASMIFTPKDNLSEAGISLFQNDDNYFMYTIVKEGKDLSLKLIFSEKGIAPTVINKKVLQEYAGELIFKVISKNDSYQYFYSLNKGASFIPFATSTADKILSHGYTGAYLGVYATGNGHTTHDFADFDWVNYSGFPRY